MNRNGQVSSTKRCTVHYDYGVQQGAFSVRGMVIYSLASDFMPMISQAEETRIPSPVNLTVMVELVGSLLSITILALAEPIAAGSKVIPNPRLSFTRSLLVSGDVAKANAPAGLFWIVTLLMVSGSQP